MTDNLLHPKDNKELREEIAKLIDAAGLYDASISPKGLADQILSKLDQYVKLADDETVTKKPKPIPNPSSGMLGNYYGYNWGGDSSGGGSRGSRR